MTEHLDQEIVEEVFFGRSVTELRVEVIGVKVVATVHESGKGIKRSHGLLDLFSLLVFGMSLAILAAFTVHGKIVVEVDQEFRELRILLHSSFRLSREHLLVVLSGRLLLVLRLGFETKSHL